MYSNQLVTMEDDADPLAAAGNSYLLVSDSKLTDEQKKLLREIREKFDPVNIVADTCILYEVTEFKDDSANDEFWEQYMDFFELGDDDKLIRDSKIVMEALTKE